MLTVNLSPVEGITSELGRTHFPTLNTPPDSTAIRIAEKLMLKTYTTSSYIYNPVQFYHNQWKTGKISQHDYSSVIERLSLDTSGIASETALDASVTFLLGRKSNAETLILVVDENNNNRLDDDKVLVISDSNRVTSSSQIPNMPKVHITNMPVFLDGRIVQTSTTFFINTNSIYLPNSANGLQNDAISIELITGEYKKGKFKYKGKRYIVGVRQVHHWQIDEAKSTIIKIANRREDSVFMRKWKTRPAYKQGAIIALEKGTVELTSVKYIEGLLSFRPSAKSNGISYKTKANVSSPNAELAIGGPSSEYLNNTASTLSGINLKGKVVLLNFWFAKCPPCIAEFESLNQLYAKLKDKKDFAFMSFTFEKSDVVKEFRKKYNLQFPILTITEDECAKLMQNPFYPTNIVLDKNGIVKYYKVGGKTNQAEASQYILTEVFSKIKEEL